MGSDTERQQNMRRLMERLYGPDYYQRMQEQERKREEEYRQWEQERKRQEEEDQRMLQERERRRKIQYLYTHSIEIFLKEEEGFRYDPTGTITSQKIYALYERWCTQKGILPESPRKLLSTMKEEGSHYNIRPCQNLLTDDGRRVRGFRGMTPTPEETQ